MQVNNKRFVIQKNYFDGKTYIGTFRFVKKTLYAKGYEYPFETKLEVAVFKKPSNPISAFLTSTFVGSHALLQFTELPNITRAEIDSFVSSIIEFEDFKNFDNDKSIDDCFEKFHYLRFLTKSLNLPSFKFIKTIIYMKVDSVDWSRHKSVR